MIDILVPQNKGRDVSRSLRAIPRAFLGRPWVYHGPGTETNFHILYFVLIDSVRVYILVLLLANTTNDPEYR